jgi:hypothetical protein
MLPCPGAKCLLCCQEHLPNGMYYVTVELLLSGKGDCKESLL